ncbi:cytochrome c oxidase subunit II [bacterium]|nr:cytochrome c oxidase subunit II [bacterium]
MNSAFANTTAAVDAVFWFIVIVSLVLLLLVTGLMVYFAVRYHRTRHPRSEPVRESAALEIAWTVIPTILVLLMFWYGYRAFLMMRAVPADALVVKAVGQMWRWDFEYPNGKKTDVLYVPAGQAIKVELQSLDVLHGFFIPAFRVKEDVVPGRANYLWFKPQGIGPADIFCSQYCGLKHAYMIGQVEVMNPDDFQAWYASDAAAPTNLIAAVDQATPGYQALDKYGCLVCHRLDNTDDLAPSFRGLWNRTVTVVANGQERTVVAEAEYLRRAVRQPSAELTKGYQDLMPPTDGITEPELNAIIDFLKSLK